MTVSRPHPQLGGIANHFYEDSLSFLQAEYAASRTGMLLIYCHVAVNQQESAIVGDDNHSVCSGVWSTVEVHLCVDIVATIPRYV